VASHYIFQLYMKTSLNSTVTTLFVNKLLLFIVASLLLFWHEIFLNALLNEICVSITDKDPPLCIFMLVDAFSLTSRYNHVVWHPGVFSGYETKSIFFSLSWHNLTGKQMNFVYNSCCKWSEFVNRVIWVTKYPWFQKVTSIQTQKIWQWFEYVLWCWLMNPFM